MFEFLLFTSGPEWRINRFVFQRVSATQFATREIDPYDCKADNILLFKGINNGLPNIDGPGERDAGNIGGCEQLWES